MKYFNTAGPIIRDSHDVIPLAEHIDLDQIPKPGR